MEVISRAVDSLTASEGRAEAYDLTTGNGEESGADTKALICQRP